MNTKTCSKCDEEKSLIHFSKNKSQKDGLCYICRQCDKISYLNYTRTRKGVLGVIFSGQKQSCKQREMSPPTYSRKELELWLFSQDKFSYLYDSWVNSGYKTTLKPSIDRVDDYKSYTLDNIQLMTWGENRSKSHNDRKTGVNYKKSKRVIQSNKDTGEFIDIFNSPSLAARKMGINSRVIDYCCLHKLRFIGEYNFRYVD
jgi:hypothetical protein